MEIIAHRGTPRDLPENSLPGFARALEAGVQGIELDVHLTADGVAAVHHDPVLHGTVAGSSGGKISDLALADLRRHTLAPGVPIPTLAEVLGLVSGRAVVYVEVKAPNAEQAVLQCIAASSTSCAVHSFDHRVALRIAQHQAARSADAVGGPAPPAANGALPTGILVSSYLIDPVGALRAARARDYWQQWDLIDRDLVARIHDAGGRVIAWTVNDVSDAARLAALGVDAACTDVPAALGAALGHGRPG